jgi:hypothetical protein
MTDSFEQKPAAMFPNSRQVACVCCRVNLATSRTDGTCDDCSRVLTNMAYRKVLAHQELRSPHPSSIRRPSPPFGDIFAADDSSVDASSLRQSGASSLVNPLPTPPPPPILQNSLPSSTSVSAVTDGSKSTLGFVEQLLSGNSISSGYGSSSLLNHGFRLVVDWGLAPHGTNITSVLSNFVLPPGISAAVPKKFFTDDPLVMLQDLSLLRNQFVPAVICQKVLLFQHEIILVKAAFNRIVRDYMKFAMLEFSRLHVSSTGYSPVTRLTNLDDLEVEFKSNTRPNWHKWYHATLAQHTVLWRKGRSDNCNLDLLTMHGMELMGIDYRVNANECGGGCFRRAATRVFHNLSTHLKGFATLYKIEQAKVTCFLFLLTILCHLYY